MKNFKKRKYVHPSNFISNLEKRDKYNLLNAAKKTNTRIYFEDRAFDGNGMPLKDLVAVFSSDEGQDCGDMWLEFNYANTLFRRNFRQKRR